MGEKSTNCPPSGLANNVRGAFGPSLSLGTFECRGRGKGRGGKAIGFHYYFLPNLDAFVQTHPLHHPIQSISTSALQTGFVPVLMMPPRSRILSRLAPTVFAEIASSIPSFGGNALLYPKRPPPSYPRQLANFHPSRCSPTLSTSRISSKKNHTSHVLSSGSIPRFSLVYPPLSCLVGSGNVPGSPNGPPCNT